MSSQLFPVVDYISKTQEGILPRDVNPSWLSIVGPLEAD